MSESTLEMRMPDGSWRTIGTVEAQITDTDSGTIQCLVNNLIGDMVRLTAIQVADVARDRQEVAPKHGPRNRWGALR